MHRARPRLARLERPLLAAGLALITVHLLDLALSGPDTLLVAVLAIVAVPTALLLALPRATRATRFAVAASLGALFTGFTAASELLHAVLQGPAWTDVSGLGALLGGLLLIGSGIAALAAPSGGRPRVLHALLWAAGAFATFTFVLMPLTMTLLTGHAPRNPVHESSLTVAHEEVRVPTADGRQLSAWYVPSRNRAAVVLIHGSTGNRSRVADRAELLARHGYGVLALDLPGNGESDGRSSGLGDNAQPAVRAAVDYLQRRPDVDPDAIAGFGVSLGGEVLLEGAAYDERLAAVISDGAARPQDADRVEPAPPPTAVALAMIRGVSGMRPAPSLIDVVPEIAPRPVLLIGSGGDSAEIPVTRLYAQAAGTTAQVWEIPEAGHTGGLRARPAGYERRVIGFLDEALGLDRSRRGDL
ncbi:MAG TPA: alpha/beta fold hydrolase [Solirubrobacteraceae bacterium]|nr:alpha/beta fold hydrolase [Solirubrobacteraceae bacterium]